MPVLPGEFESHVRAAGLKMTPQRAAIFRALASTRSHPSAETVYNMVRNELPSVSLDTVYRTLATFAEHGLCLKLLQSDGTSRFDGDTAPHHHLICDVCGMVTDVQWSALDRCPLPNEVRNWGDISHHTIELRGTCRDCLPKTR